MTPADPLSPDEEDKTRILPGGRPHLPAAADATRLEPREDRTVYEPREDQTVFEPRVSLPPPPPPAPAPARAPAATLPSGGGGNALPPGTRLGEFELQRVLGEGGFGIVYLAWDSMLERRVAVKEYMPSSLASRAGSSTQVYVKSERYRETFELGLKSFIKEAKTLAQFDHPSLVKVYRYWEAHGTAYMAMPFYEGRTLKDELMANGLPSEDWLMAMLDPLTEALRVVHGEQWYHRDIAPDNIMLLAGSGRPLLLDFGAARRVIGDMTQALTVILKPGYAPLEQYAEVPDMRQGPWTDIYALCAVLYYAIAGKTPPPAVGRMLNDTLVPLTSMASLPPGRHSQRLLQAVMAGLSVRPEDRTQNIDEFRRQIGLDGGMPAPAPTASAARPAPAPAAGARPAAAPQPAPAALPAPAGASGRRLWVAAAGMAGLAAVGGGLYAVLSPSRARRSDAAPDLAASAALPPVSAAPAPVPAQAAAPAAASPRDALAGRLREIYEQRDPAVTAQLQLSSPRLVVDRDSLTFSFTPGTESYAYLLFLDQEGALNLIFPSYGFESNQVKAGQKIDMPKGVALAPSAPAGTWSFLLLLSRYPRDFSRFGQHSAKNYGWLPITGDVSAAIIGAPLCRSGDCRDSYGALWFETQVVMP